MHLKKILTISEFRNLLINNLMSESNNVIQLNQITRYFTIGDVEVKALQGVNLNIARGE